MQESDSFEEILECGVEIDESFIGENIPNAPSMSDFYPDVESLTIERRENVGEALQPDADFEQLQTDETLSNELRQIPDEDSNFEKSKTFDEGFHSKSENFVTPLLEAHKCQVVRYPSLPANEMSIADELTMENFGFEANAPPMFNEELSTAFEASAPMFDDEVVAEVADEAIEEQEREESYVTIQPFTETQVCL